MKQVMRGHKFRHFVAPTHEGAKLRQARFSQPLENILSPAGDDRHVQLGHVAQMSEDLHGELRNSTRKEDRLPSRLLRRWSGLERFESLGHRKPEGVDFFGRDAIL